MRKLMTFRSNAFQIDVLQRVLSLLDEIAVTLEYCENRWSADEFLRSTAEIISLPLVHCGHIQ